MGYIDEAIRHADAAIDRSIPRLFGRNGAEAAIRSGVADAATWLESARSSLHGSGAPVEDALRAVDEVVAASRSTDAWFVDRAGAPKGYRNAVDQLRTSHESLDFLARGIEATDEASTRSWLVASLAAGAPDGAVALAREFGRQGHPGLVDPIARAALAQIDEASVHTIRLAEAAVLGERGLDPQLVLGALSQAARTGSPVDRLIVREAFERLPVMSDQLQVAMPAAVAEGVGAVTLDAVDTARLRLAVRPPTTTEATTLVDEVLARTTAVAGDGTLGDAAALARALEATDPAWSGIADDLAMAATTTGSEADEALRSGWARRISGTDEPARLLDDLLDPDRDVVDSVRRIGHAPELLAGIGTDAWREQLAAHALGAVGADDAAAIRTAIATVRDGGPVASRLAAADRIARSNAAATIDDARMLAPLSLLPDGMRPDALDDAAKPLLQALRDGTTHAVVDVRWKLERTRLLEDGPDAVAGAIRSQVAMADDTIDDDSMRRIRRLVGAAREIGLRPPTSRGRATLTDLIERGASPAGGSSDAAEYVRDLRRWTVADSFERDPRLSTRKIVDAMAEIVDKSDEHVTGDDMLQLAGLRTINPSLRPKMPYAATKQGLDGVAIRGRIPSSSSDARAEVDVLRRWVGHHRIYADPDATPRSLFEELAAIVAKADDDITESDMQRLATIRTLGGDKQLEMPRAVTKAGLVGLSTRRAVPASSSDARAEIDALRRWIGRHEISVDPDVSTQTLVDEIAAIVAKADDDITETDMHRLALIESVGGDKQVDTPRAMTKRGLAGLSTSRSIPASSSDARAEVDSLRRWIGRREIHADPAITPSTLVDEVATIVAKADDDITNADMHRLATIVSLGGDKAIGAPRPATKEGIIGLSTRRMVPATSSKARSEVTTLRQWVAHRLMLADPDVTRESLRAQVARIVAKPNEQLTQADVDQLAVIATLPGEKRPAFPKGVTKYGIDGIARNQWLPSNTSWARHEVTAIRRMVEHERLVADPTVTPEVLINQVATIAARHPDDITSADVERVATIATLPGAKRPKLPPSVTKYGLAGVASNEWLPSSSSWARKEYEALRAWTVLHTEAGRTATIEAVRDGGYVSNDVVRQLAADPSILRAAGLGPVDLLPPILDDLEKVTAGGSNPSKIDLELLQAIATSITPTTPTERGTHAVLVRAVEHSLGRLERQGAGYSDYIDFAELGRGITAGRLLRTMVHESRSAAQAAGTGLAW